MERTDSARLSGFQEADCQEIRYGEHIGMNGKGAQMVEIEELDSELRK